MIDRRTAKKRIATQRRYAVDQFIASGGQNVQTFIWDYIVNRHQPISKLRAGKLNLTVEQYAQECQKLRVLHIKPELYERLTSGLYDDYKPPLILPSLETVTDEN